MGMVERWRTEGRLIPLSTAEAEQTQHELAQDPGACFFRVFDSVAGQDEQPPLRQGDVLIVIVDASPNEGDLIVVRLEGNGHLLGRSRRGGSWCLLASGAAVPLDASGSEVHLAGVVMGVLRKVDSVDAAPASG
jgi:SOS-response transcriptional repressor LexA